MSDRYVTLIGTEQVQTAANTMRTAADEMRHAAGTISEALDRHQRFLDDWLGRFEAVLRGVSRTP
jgi:hypothetical protein